jgi:hypothetical protein
MTTSRTARPYSAGLRDRSCPRSGGRFRTARRLIKQAAPGCILVHGASCVAKMLMESRDRNCTPAGFEPPKRGPGPSAPLLKRPKIQGFSASHSPGRFGRFRTVSTLSVARPLHANAMLCVLRLRRRPQGANVTGLIPEGAPGLRLTGTAASRANASARSWRVCSLSAHGPYVRLLVPPNSAIANVPTDAFNIEPPAIRPRVLYWHPFQV